MNQFTPSQLKTLSEFMNTIAAAWFTAGVIAPLFIKPESIIKIIPLVGIAVLMTASFLGWSLFLVRRIKI